MSGDGTEPEQRCDFCRLPCPVEPVTAEYEGATYHFCSPACREAMAASDRVFTEYRGYWRFDPGVSALDATLPQGMPRNSFVLLAGQTGTRDRAVHAELVWRALQRGEPAVVVTFQEPSTSAVETFLLMEWNVLPYLQSGQLHVLDCFTYRMDDRDRMHERMNEWNKHLRRITEPATTHVRDPSDTNELANKLDSCLDDRDMVDTGLVVIDSLTEFGSLVQPIQAYSFVKDLRADVCKGRFVPVFAGATYAGESDTFPHDLDYVADGVVDMELNSSVVENALIKRVRVRKMSGVLAYSQWRAYEYTSGTGLVTFDPAEEMGRSDDASDDGGGTDLAGTESEETAGSGGADGAETASGGEDRTGTDPAASNGESDPTPADADSTGE